MHVTCVILWTVTMQCGCALYVPQSNMDALADVSVCLSAIAAQQRTSSFDCVSACKQKDIAGLFAGTWCTEYAQRQVDRSPTYWLLQQFAGNVLFSLYRLGVNIQMLNFSICKGVRRWKSFSANLILFSIYNWEIAFTCYFKLPHHLLR